MMASVVKDKNLGQKAQAKVAKALSVLFTQASTRSADANSNRQTFFVTPKGAYDPQAFDLTQINLHTLSTLIEARKAIKLSAMSFDEAQFSLYRNYFDSKAAGTSNLQTAYYALRGLKNLADQAFFVDAPGADNRVVFDGSKRSLTFSSVDAFQTPVQITKIKSAKLIQLDNGKETNVIDKVQL